MTTTSEYALEPPDPGASSRQFRALAAFVLVLGLLAVFTAERFVAPVIVAAWFAGLTAPLAHRLGTRLGGRHRTAAVATALLVLIIVGPTVALAVPLANAVSDVVRDLAHGRVGDVVRRFVTQAQSTIQGGGGGSGLQGAVQSGQGAMAGVLGALSRVLSALSVIGAQLFILAVSAYYFSAEGGKILRWMERGSPIAPAHFRRLAHEFMEVARAMLVGELLVVLTQAVIAGAVFFALGVPNALLLTVLTFFVGFIPSVGAALVWVPVSIGLAVSGNTRDAAILAGLGLCVVSTVDNVLRPYFARIGARQLHPLLLFLGIFGGLEAFGGWGLILGPLILSVFVAAFRLYAREAERQRALRAEVREGAAAVPTHP